MDLPYTFFQLFSYLYDSLILVALSLLLLNEFYRRWDAACHAAEERQRTDLVVPNYWAGWTWSLCSRSWTKTPHAAEVPRRGKALFFLHYDTIMHWVSSWSQLHGSVALSYILLFLQLFFFFWDKQPDHSTVKYNYVTCSFNLQWIF